MLNAFATEETALMLCMTEQLHLTHFTHSRMFVFKRIRLNTGGRKTENKFFKYKMGNHIVTIYWVGVRQNILLPFCQFACKGPVGNIELENSTYCP